MTKTVLHRLALASLALTALTVTASADWRDQITNYDADRLTHLEDSRAGAVQEAQTRGGSGDFRAIQETFNPEARGVPEQALMGT